MEEPEPPALPLDEDSRITTIMARFKDSLLSKLRESYPSINTDDASSYIQRRLSQLFPSFNTPTHPAYNWMIYRAITELNDGSGLSEKAISDFIVREYKDLPWAHARILGIQLKQLCENGELVYNEGGRYVLVADGVGGNGTGVGEGTVECKGSKKRKRGKKRKGRMGRCEHVERVSELKEERITNKQIPVSQLDGARNDEQSRAVECTEEQEEETQQNPSIERVEEQVGSEKRLLEGAGEQSQSQLQETGVTEQHMEAEAPAQSEVEESQIQGCNQESSKGNKEEKPMFGDPEQKPPKYSRPRNSETDVNYLGELLSSDDGILNKQNLDPNIDKMENRHQYGRGRGRGRGLGRPPKLDENADQYEKLLQQKDQVQHSVQHRGRGRPRKLNQSANQCEEQLQQADQALHHGRGSGRGRGRPRKLDHDAMQSEEHLQPQDQGQDLPQLLPQVIRKGSGRPPKASTQCQQQQLETCQRLSREIAVNSLSDINQSIEQLRSQLCEVEGYRQQGQGGDQNQDLGQETPPDPVLDASHSHELLQPEAREDQCRHNGNPPECRELKGSLPQPRSEGRQLRRRTA